MKNESTSTNSVADFTTRRSALRWRMHPICTYVPYVGKHRTVFSIYYRIQYTYPCAPEPLRLRARSLRHISKGTYRTITVGSAIAHLYVRYRTCASSSTSIAHDNDQTTTTNGRQQSLLSGYRVGLMKIAASSITFSLAPHPMFESLSLHDALRHTASPIVIRMILMTNPKATHVEDGEGLLPLHVALHVGASSKVIGMLLQAYSQAIRKKY
jgi:hypothetical protein